MKSILDVPNVGMSYCTGNLFDVNGYVMIATSVNMAGSLSIEPLSHLLKSMAESYSVQPITINEQWFDIFGFKLVKELGGVDEQKSYSKEVDFEFNGEAHSLIFKREISNIDNREVVAWNLYRRIIEPNGDLIEILCLVSPMVNMFQNWFFWNFGSQLDLDAVKLKKVNLKELTNG
jgi:hypothetical protein